MSSEVSVVVPNLNSSVIDEVVSAVLEQADEVSCTLDVWVVGQDRHRLVRPNARVHFLLTPSPVWPAEARNLGASASEGRRLIFLDADCVPQSGWLVAMLDATDRWPDFGAISGAMLPAGDTFALECGQVSGFHEHLNLNPSCQRRALASFSLLMPRTVWAEVGRFDEQFRCAEDLDISARTALLGYPLYFEPGAVVRHRPERGSLRSLWRHAIRAGTQSIQVRQRHADYYRMPRWTASGLLWILLSPVIAVGRTIQIYKATPGLRYYWRCAPWVVLSKLAWCWGAAVGLTQTEHGSARRQDISARSAGGG